ncbi:methionine--tRNA ligase [Ferrovum sp. JA12]|uniref:methionine--tRNA ligase n=1 Tax=Ferrovum sp. JA12 TaxID=1356299 RepID=UPI00070272D9|nr:methionine--tRNA ligase [Ferrovum sp. JA12]KRH78478.1 methionine--tRNA ligase [Ferrovum sp. JA12]
MPRTMIVTSALPYANGSIHLGHMVEHIQTDIWVRHQRMNGHTVHYLCADDTHGTPVMLAANQLGISPEQMIEKARQEHMKDFTGFLIDHDLYYSTHTPETEAFAKDIYLTLKQAGLIDVKPIEQLFDPEKEMFLPDRFIKGECPRCHAKDQYGDNCEVCGASYSPTELIQPVSAISGATPIKKTSEHYFFKLKECESFLRQWTRSGTIPEEAANKLEEWFKSGLTDWDISRDKPYFGFEIPDAPGKYFYVWLDAPIGYIGTFKKFADTKGLPFWDYWKADSTTELYHFIGKDILYFHSLFWPAMLYAANLRTPTRLFVHGFLTVNGQKMSKSRGSFITAQSYLKHLNPESLRYYFAAKMNSSMDDIDLNLDDFTNRVNSDLVGKFINIASRTSGFITKRFNGKLATGFDELALPIIDRFYTEALTIKTLFEEREFAKAIREIMALADLANQYIDQQKPWELAKDQKHLNLLHQVCTSCLEMFRCLSIYLKPVLPKLTQQVETFLKLSPLMWKHLDKKYAINACDILPYHHLISRIETKQIEELQSESKSSLIDKTNQDHHFPPLSETIGIDDFSKIDLRVAKIIDAVTIPEADKLLKLTLDLGFEQRTVFAGIKSQYQSEQLVGRLTVMVANLSPRKMRFGESQGMVLAAGDGNTIYLLSPDSGAKPGMKIK